MITERAAHPGQEVLWAPVVRGADTSGGPRGAQPLPGGPQNVP